MQLVITDEVVDKASEVEEEDEVHVLVALLVMRVKVMEKESLGTAVSRTSLMKGLKEK